MNENESLETMSEEVAVNEESVNEEPASAILPAEPDDRPQMQAEIERLRGEVARLTEWQTRSRGELDEFCLLFPNVPLSALPDEVRGQVDAGVPLAAAYALFEKREAHRRDAGKKSAERSWHGMNESAGGEYYSPEEVKSMSQKEVHKNYKKIIESMKHWK